MVASCDLLAGCATYCCNNIKELVDAEVVAPFVSVTVSSPDATITVGNQSSPQAGNHAVINSLKYSFSFAGGGFTVELEIVDDQGGSFDAFISHLVTVIDWEKIEGNKLIVTWGWLNAACGSTAVGNEGELRSVTHVFKLIKIHFNYDKGLVKYRLECTDIEHITEKTTNYGVWGDDKNAVTLKDAIRSLCNKYKIDVSFRRTGDDSSDAWDFMSDKKNVQGRWEEKGETLIAVIRRWIEGFTTDKDLGIFLAFNSTNDPNNQKNNELVLWEDIFGRCGEIRGCDSRSVGTYIVNGGGSSPVIRFTPSLHWTFTGLNDDKSGSQNPAGKDMEQNTEEPDCKVGPSGDNIPNKGLPKFLVVSENSQREYGLDDSLKGHIDAMARHQKANGNFIGGIQADLVIQGDPDLADIPFVAGKVASIVVIEPFFINKSGNGCGDWLQIEPCNRVLTNHHWQINGVTHEISRGSYTTTLSLLLAAPGQDRSVGEPFGGADNGYTINS